ncbi:PhoH family protein [Parvularcula dongshanensis]|uniref:PhoH-like protein n=1 Tax=Parvularcula dongshanensis TaxID=1173995 RepID=A0A840I065_9PROT|nr:PhoH family protein [Parvularcula dongshanensis]MBB4657644.1 phosphate starvation-inducible PhoH-like protein [Parvularcula dongshanensis]
MTRRSSKRSIKRAGKAQSEDRRAWGQTDNVRPLFEDGWSPLGPAPDGPRDQSYVKNVRPRGDNQAEMMALIDERSVVFATGPAGTGKTYLAVAKAVEALEAGEVGRIVLSRPAVEAGESLGFLPGDMEEKLSPYLRPLYDALTDRLSAKKVRALMAEGVIEVAPIAFMRGRTLNNAFVVIDEAQNCTYAQLKMLLTRLGWHSTMVVTGDPAQSDLLPGVSGLADIVEKLEGVEDIGCVRFVREDVVRHPLVARMVEAI